VFVSKKELAVQVAEIDRIEIDNVDFSEACEDEVLQELASDASGAYHEHSALCDIGQRHIFLSAHTAQLVAYSFNAREKGEMGGARLCVPGNAQSQTVDGGREGDNGTKVTCFTWALRPLPRECEFEVSRVRGDTETGTTTVVLPLVDSIVRAVCGGFAMECRGWMFLGG